MCFVCWKYNLWLSGMANGHLTNITHGNGKRKKWKKGKNRKSTSKWKWIANNSGYMADWNWYRLRCGFVCVLFVETSNEPPHFNTWPSSPFKYTNSPNVAFKLSLCDCVFDSGICCCRQCGYFIYAVNIFRFGQILLSRFASLYQNAFQQLFIRKQRTWNGHYARHISNHLKYIRRFGKTYCWVRIEPAISFLSSSSSVCVCVCLIYGKN